MALLQFTTERVTPVTMRLPKTVLQATLEIFHKTG
jgi:hypothetical protein